MDISGNYEGGGVCLNCQHNTEGINCHKCVPGYFRPYGKELTAWDVCESKFLKHISFQFRNCNSGAFSLFFQDVGVTIILPLETARMEQVAASVKKSSRNLIVIHAVKDTTTIPTVNRATVILTGQEVGSVRWVGVNVLANRTIPGQTATNVLRATIIFRIACPATVIQLAAYTLFATQMEDSVNVITNSEGGGAINVNTAIMISRVVFVSVDVG